MVRPIVHSVKHYVQHSIATTVSGAVSFIVVAQAKEVSGVTAVNDIREGSSIKAFWLELWIRTADTAHGSFVVIVEKQPGSQTVNATAANMAALGDYTNKKNILYSCQGLSNDQDADAIPVYKGWIKVPKSKQRMGLDDKIVITTFAQALDQVTCGLTTYKEYF